MTWRSPRRTFSTASVSLSYVRARNKTPRYFRHHRYKFKYPPDFYRDMTEARITDLSSIDAENFKFRNERFFKGDYEYDVQNHYGMQEISRKIWNTRNGDLRRVLREFPKDEPLVDQCAGWMHAVAGKHFFPDANHRTAMALLRKLLHDNSIELAPLPPQRAHEASLRSHEVRNQIEPVRLDTLYRKDRLFLVWRLYFEPAILYE